MKIKEKALFIQSKLQELYPNPPVPLDSVNTYTFLLAVLLSAQCTDKRVNEVSPELFSLASTPEDMLKLSQQQVKTIIRPCGLSDKKSAAILDLSRILLECHEGKVPSQLEELTQLPGVGHKTASVVLSQKFNIAAFPVDTHIQRLAYRWGLSNSKKNVVITERHLKKIFPKEKWRDLHLQFIFYGRDFCQARKHNSNKCIICSKCGVKSRI